MKDVKGYEGLYGVTRDGRVWSYPRTWTTGAPPMKQSSKGGWKTQHLNNKGYLLVGLSNRRRQCSKTVHRLVAEAFINNPDGKAQVNHKNGKKVDNRAENLEWVTNQENRSHAIENGIISQRGSANNAAKLTEKDVPLIRQLLATGQTQQSIADLFVVSREAITLIKNGRRWAHIQ